MTCCRSTPRCRTCPVLLAAQARNRAPQGALASVFDQIYGPAQPRLPDAVSDALLALADARERYRFEHTAARGSRYPPAAAAPPI